LAVRRHTHPVTRFQSASAGDGVAGMIVSVADQAKYQRRGKSDCQQEGQLADDIAPRGSARMSYAPIARLGKECHKGPPYSL
jgi:hypothetical protein